MYCNKERSWEENNPEMLLNYRCNEEQNTPLYSRMCISDIFYALALFYVISFCCSHSTFCFRDQYEHGYLPPNTFKQFMNLLQHCFISDKCVT